MVETVAPTLTASQQSLLERLAAKYIWWKSPQVSIGRPERVIAQVMDIGDYEDVLELVAVMGEPALKQALKTAGPGQLSPRSWNYWHLKLGLAEQGSAPPVPIRRFK